MGKAEHLNKYFATISNLQEKDINLPLLHRQSNSTINSIQLSEDEIKDIIKSIPINKATGPDQISLIKTYLSIGYKTFIDIIRHVFNRISLSHQVETRSCNAPIQERR